MSNPLLLSSTVCFSSVAGGSERKAASRGGGVRPGEKSSDRGSETSAAAGAFTQGAAGTTGPAGEQPPRPGAAQHQPSECTRD